MKSITVPAVQSELDNVRNFINGELDNFDCSPKARFQMELAVEEIFVNIASYAYSPSVGDASVSCEISDDSLTASVIFSDMGKPFDPLAKEDADTSEEALLGREGGLGILMTKKVMDEVTYSYENGKNILTIKKNIK